MSNIFIPIGGNQEDSEDISMNFTQSSTRTNLSSGEKLATSLGKIMMWFTDLKAIAFSGNVSDLSGTLPVDKGGTGVTTPAALRNILGLGNTTGALPIANGGTGATTASAALTALGGLPLTGGTMTGLLGFKIGSRTDIPLRIYSGDANGNALVLQAGGLTILGGGEAGTNLYTALANENVNATAERVYIAADTTMYFCTNCQTIANRKTVSIDATGKVTAPGGFSGALNPSNLSSAVPLAKGGTGATTAAAARTSLGAAAASHTHAASQVTSGNLLVGVKATNSTDYTTSRVRNIRFGTTAPTSLENGEIFIVYE